MSGVAPDPLDRIANWMTSSLNRSPHVEIDREVALALVEIARAARDTASRVVDGPEFDLGELFNSAGRLDAALARLDKQAQP